MKSLLPLLLLFYISGISPTVSRAEQVRETVAYTIVEVPAIEVSDEQITEVLHLTEKIPSSPVAWKDPTRFRARQLILPGALIGVGIAGVYLHGFLEMKDHVDGIWGDVRGKHYFHLDDYIQYLPAAAYLPIGFFKVKSRHTFKERVAAEATAYAAMIAMVKGGKKLFGEKRPDSNARNSFPSGHTSVVFTGAELIREEYGLGFGIAAYTVAVGVGTLRMYNGRHWLNDVIAGAGIGILSARIGYWMLPVYRRLFRWKEKGAGESMVFVPGYDPQEQTMSLSMSLLF